MPEFVVASTTDTQEAVNQAAGAVAEPEVEAKESKDPAPEQKESPKPETEAKDKVPRGVEKRIDRLTKEKYELQERLAALEQQVRTQQAPPVVQQQPEPVQAIPETTPKPKQEDFQTYEEWVEAVSDWKIDQRLAKMAAEEQQAAVAEAQREIFDTYKERVNEFKKDHADWDAVIQEQGEMVLPPGVGPTILEMENGPEVAYYLAKHPEVSKRLNQMNPYSAIAEIGKLAATMGRDQAITTPGFRTDRVPVSNAPEPIKPLSGHSTKSTVSADDMPYAEYRAWRDKQEKNRYKR